MNVRIPEKYRMVAADATLLLIASIWGGGFIASKEALATMPSFGVMAARFLSSALVMFVLFHRTILAHHSKKDIFFGVVIGVIQFIAFIFQLEGLSLTTVEKQYFLITSYVIFVPFLSWIATRQRIRKLDIVCAVLAVIGLGLLCLKPENLTFQLGDILSVIAALFFGIQIVYVANFVKGANMISMSFFQLATIGILGLPFSGISGITSGDINAFLGIAYLALFNTAFAFSAQNIAQQYTTDAHASLLISFESVFGFLLAVWFYGSVVTGQEIVGCVCMLAAVLLSNVKKG